MRGYDINMTWKETLSFSLNCSQRQEDNERRLTGARTNVASSSHTEIILIGKEIT